MPTEVTDPALLQQLNGGDDSQTPAPTSGGEVTDPDVLRMLNADKPQDDTTPLGERIPTEFPDATAQNQPKDELPFWDRVHMAQADNWGEKKLYLEKTYGKGSVKEEWGDDGEPAAVVTTQNGKVFRIGDSGFVATLVGDAPEGIGMAGGAAMGAAYGSAFGPAGTLLGGLGGAAVGAAVGKGASEMQKSAEGINNKSWDEEGDTIWDAEKSGMESEAVGGLVGKGVSKALTAHLPGVITGTTEAGRKLTQKVWAGGGRVGYKAMANSLKKIQLIENLDERVNGEAVAMVERNQGFIINHVKDTLKSSGVPKPYIEKITEDMRDPQGALSHEGVGKEIQQAVQTHIDTVQAAIDNTATVADTQIDAQLSAVSSIIDKTTHNGIDETTGTAIQTAKRTFSDAARKMYDRIDTMLGGRKVVDAKPVYEVAADIVKKMPPAAVSKMIRDAAQNYGKQMSAEDALLLSEFGIQMDKEGGKITFGEAQGNRSLLREKGKTGELNRSISQGAHARLAGAYDDAIQAAVHDPDAAPAINALNSTDKWYQATNAKFKDATIKGFIKRLQTGMPRDAESIVDTITEVGQSSRTGQIRKIVGEDTWKKVQSVHLSKFLGEHSTKGPDGKPVYDGIKILQSLEKDDPARSFEQVHGPGTLQQMREIATMVAAKQGKLDPSLVANGDVRGALESITRQKQALDEFMSKNALGAIANPNKSGEQAYQWLASPGATNESHLIDALNHFGENSPQMSNLRQAALEDVMRQATIKAIGERGNSAIEQALNAYTERQADILFPGGLKGDLKAISKVIAHITPEASGTVKKSNAGQLVATGILMLPLPTRIPIQVVIGAMRSIVQHPSIARWICIGRKENEFKWMQRTAVLLNKMSAQVNLENEQPEAPQPPPTQMPGPATIQ